MTSYFTCPFCLQICLQKLLSITNVSSVSGHFQYNHTLNVFCSRISLGLDQPAPYNRLSKYLHRCTSPPCQSGTKGPNNTTPKCWLQSFQACQTRDTVRDTNGCPPEVSSSSIPLNELRNEMNTKCWLRFEVRCALWKKFCSR